LMGVALNNDLYMSGGRTRHGVGFSAEVWRSSDDGLSWQVSNKEAFGARAYHVHLVVDGCQIVMGGQTFFTFYNDVWRSCDAKGEVWERVLEEAPWQPRAGLAAVVTKGGDIVVAGGCYNKNGNPAKRSFLGDVWRSSDGGLTWEEVTPEAQWTARSGPRLVETADGGLLIVAGEIGFTPDTQLVDIWRSDDGGAQWELVTKEPGFSERSGHGVIVDGLGRVWVIAGWPHLHDLWVSENGGQTFRQVSDSVFDCGEDKCGKFDFWPMLSEDGTKLFTIGGSGAYSTFGTLFNDVWVSEI